MHLSPKSLAAIGFLTNTAQVNLTARETTDTSGRSATAQNCDFGKKPGS
jgi:hypothetical protein